MPYKIDTKIGIDGEAAYKAAIKDVSSSLKVLKAEMRAVTSAFDENEKSAEALTKENDVLKRTSDELRKKLAEQEKQLDKVKTEYGENSKKAQSLQAAVYRTTAELNKNERQLADNEKALEELSSGSKDAGKEVADLGDKAEKSDGKLKKFGETLGKGLAAASKAAVAAIGAAGAALGKIIKDSITASGELEQNLGGSEAVFKDYAEQMQSIAKGAYKEMGLSASDFLATANKMGALFQGSGFEIEESSELSAKAMQRAADVASIMGLDVSAAMDAVAGAAKGNFTMMDNLGVAINDTTLKAYAQEKGLGELKTTHDKVSAAMALFLEKTEYAAGNYAKENETLAGSINTLKAAWDNFLAGVGDPKGLAEAAVGAFTAIMTKVKEMLPAIVQGLTGLVREIIPYIGPMVRELLPELLNSAIELVKELSAALPDIIAAIAEMLPDVISGVAAVLPTAVSALVDGIVVLINSLTEQMDVIVPALVDAAIAIVDALTEPENLKAILVGLVKLVAALIVEIGKKLPDLAVSLISAVINLATALFESFTQIWNDLGTWFGETFGGAFEEIKLAFEPIFIWADGVLEKIKEIFRPIVDFFGDLFERAKNAAADRFDGLKNRLETTWEAIKEVYTPVVEWFGDLFERAKNTAADHFAPLKDQLATTWETIKTTYAPAVNWFGELFGNAADAAADHFAPLKDRLLLTWESIKTVFAPAVEWFRDTFEEVGKEIVRGVWDGIVGLKDWLFGKVDGFFGGLVGDVKKTLGIASPSKVFAEIGGNTAEGFGIGFTNVFAGVQKNIVEKIGEFTFYAEKEFNRLTGLRDETYAAWAMRRETMSEAETNAENNAAATRLKEALEEIKAYDGTKRIIERGGRQFVLEFNELRMPTVSDLMTSVFPTAKWEKIFDGPENAIEEVAETAKEIIEEIVEIPFVPANLSAMSAEDFYRWKAGGFGERVVREPITSAAGAAAATATAGSLDQVLAAIRALPVMPEQIVVETTIDGEKVASAIWNPLNAVAEQKGQPIIN